MGVVATYLRDTDNLRTLDAGDVPGALASVYDVINQTHPFREGNGRMQREFVTALARESGHRLDWTQVTLSRPGYESENDQASRLARAGDRGPLRAMFARITTTAGAIDDHVNDALRLVVMRANMARSGPRSPVRARREAWSFSDSYPARESVTWVQSRRWPDSRARAVMNSRWTRPWPSRKGWVWLTTS